MDVFPSMFSPQKRCAERNSSSVLIASSLDLAFALLFCEVQAVRHGDDARVSSIGPQREELRRLPSAAAPPVAPRRSGTAGSLKLPKRAGSIHFAQ